MAIETYKYNIKVRTGRTVRKKFTFKHKNDADELVPMSTSGWKGLLQYRKTLDSGVEDYLSSEEDNPTIIFGGTNGEMELIFTSTKTGLMIAKQFVYDLRIIYPNNEVDYPLAGVIKVTRSVTHD